MLYVENKKRIKVIWIKLIIQQFNFVQIHKIYYVNTYIYV